MRLLHEIASEIDAVWKTANIKAYVCIRAMRHLNYVDETFAGTHGTSLVESFLSHARHFRGPDARRLKAELRDLL